MTEQEIIRIVKEIQTFGASHLYNTEKDAIEIKEPKHTFLISDNDSEEKFPFKVEIDTPESGAIIIALIKQEQLKTTLSSLKHFSKVETGKKLYLHYLALK